jgi:hypothetical protein
MRTGGGAIALLAAQAVWFDGTKVVKHTFSFLSPDSKEDAYHAWAYLNKILTMVNCHSATNLFCR